MADPNGPWHVLVVEDDSATRQFIADCILADSRLALAACVATRAEALEQLRDTGRQLDVILVDLGLPDGSGLDVIASACASRPGCEAIVVSVFGDDESVLAAIDAGAVGYLHKDVGAHEVAEAVVLVKQGGSPMSPAIARRVLTRLRSAERGMTADGPAVTDPLRPQLSPRETDVLRLIARGYSYAEVAARLGVSLHTVQAHVKNLYSKLWVHSKNAAVFEATRLGLLPRAP